MAKKKGYNTRYLRSKGNIYSLNQVYEQTYNSKKLSFCQYVSIFGIIAIFLIPVAIIILFFIALSIG
jgi:hypothetical protein